MNYDQLTKVAMAGSRAVGLLDALLASGDLSSAMSDRARNIVAEFEGASGIVTTAKAAA